MLEAERSCDSDGNRKKKVQPQRLRITGRMPKREWQDLAFSATNVVNECTELLQVVCVAIETKPQTEAICRHTDAALTVANALTALVCGFLVLILRAANDRLSIHRQRQAILADESLSFAHCCRISLYFSNRLHSFVDKDCKPRE